MNPMFTIGHSNHSIETFVALLQANGITAIADVRSSPYSRWSPHFSRERLEGTLKSLGMAYVYLGKELGGRPDRADLYAGNVADYEKMAQTAEFSSGLKRLLTGAGRFTVSMLCSERDPMDCHRCLLVGRHICGETNLSHIHADGRLEAHASFEDRLLSTTGLSDDLLRERSDALAGAYRMRAGSAAFRRTGES